MLVAKLHSAYNGPTVEVLASVSGSRIRGSKYQVVGVQAGGGTPARLPELGVMIR